LDFVILFSICFMWSYFDLMDFIFSRLQPWTFDLLEMELHIFFYPDLITQVASLIDYPELTWFFFFFLMIFSLISSFNIRLIRNWASYCFVFPLSHVCSVTAIFHFICLEYRENGEDNNSMSCISGKRKWETPPNFLLLETLIGLRDWARELVA
jgi:hypothetical protein